VEVGLNTKKVSQFAALFAYASIIWIRSLGIISAQYRTIYSLLDKHFTQCSHIPT